MKPRKIKVEPDSPVVKWPKWKQDALASVFGATIDRGATCVGFGNEGCGYVGGTSGEVCPQCGGMLLSEEVIKEAEELSKHLDKMPEFREPISGWRMFTCIVCSQIWEETSRDIHSPSGVECANCGDWCTPGEVRADPSLLTDGAGNIVKHQVWVHMAGFPSEKE
jgi:hypothetical protein